MKEIKDYLHLYLGCEIIGTYRDASGSKGYLTGITNGGCDCEIQFILEDGINVEEEPYINDISQVKPILRHLSDMTGNEAAQLIEIGTSVYDFIGIRKVDKYEVMFDAGYPTNNRTWLKHLRFSELEAEQFKFLLSKHFDLFGLIESGLAIDTTTIKTAKP